MAPKAWSTEKNQINWCLQNFCVSDKRVKKMWYTHTMDYYSAIKKEWNNAIAATMKGPRDDHNKWSQRKTNTICYHLHVESKKWYKWTYLQNRNRLIDIKTNLWLPQRKGGREKFETWDKQIHAII